MFLFLAYDFEAFVGNTGGYIGLFLGYALLQIPGILLYLITRCYNVFFKWDKSNVRSQYIDEKEQMPENSNPFQISPGASKASTQFPGTIDNAKYVKILKFLVKQEVQNQLKNNSPEINYNV